MILSIIIPVFNEKKTVKELLNKVNRAELPRSVTKEIIVVDDGSNDGTSGTLISIRGVKFKYLKHEKNLGKGSAVRSGLKIASGDYVIIQDADFEYDPNEYSKLLAPIINKKTEVVYGNRFKNYPLKIWGANKTILPTYWIANKMLATITNLLYGSNLEDMETCYKLFTKKVLNSLDLKAKRFEVEPEITAKVIKNGYKIFQVPIKVVPRTHKEGKKISWKDGFSAIWTLVRYRFIN